MDKGRTKRTVVEIGGVVCLLVGVALAAHLCWKLPPGAGAPGALWFLLFLLALPLIEIPVAVWASRWWGPLAAVPPAIASLLLIAYLVMGWPLSIPMGAPERLLWCAALALCTMLVGLPFALLRLWYVPIGAILLGLLVAWGLGLIRPNLRAVEFSAPLYLLLLLGIPVAWWTARRSLAGLGAERRSLSMYMRALILLFLALALARTRYMEPSRDLAVFFLIDRSKSVPMEKKFEEKLFTYMHESAERRHLNDVAGIIGFAREASIERSLRKNRPLPEKPAFSSIITRDATDIGAAIRLACAFFPENARRRIVLVSDGNENRGSALEAARWAAQQGVHFDIYPVTYRRKEEVMVERVIVPPEVRPNEPFRVTVVLRANCNAKGKVELLIDGGVEGTNPVTLEPDKQTITTFTVRRRRAMFYRIEARILLDETEGGPPQDAIMENNTALGFTQVIGSARVLLLEGSREDGIFLAQMLRDEEIGLMRARGPIGMPASQAEFLSYDLIILANVHSSAFANEDHMRMLQSAIRNGGVGFIMIGGENSFGAGGYIGTPVEETLPVNFRPKDKELMPNGALALILHTCEMPQGNYWTKKICHAAVQCLSSEDYVGMLLYGYTGRGGVGWHLKMKKAGNRAFIASRIASASPGDMPDYATAVEQAYLKLASMPVAVKHIILIGDGDASPPSPALIRKLVAAKITCTTVTVFPHSGGIPGAMQNLADATKGRALFPKTPDELPELISKEATTVRQGLIYNKTLRPSVQYSTVLIQGIAPNDFPELKAHVVTSREDTGPKARAEIPLLMHFVGHQGATVSNPLLAHWQYGLGRTVAFTSDATSNWAERWIQRPVYQKFWKQTVLWATRKRPKSNLQVRTAVEEDRVHVVVDALNDEGEPLNNLEMMANVTNPKGTEPIELALQQTAPGRYEGRFEGKEIGPYHINISYLDPETNKVGVHTTGIAISYSPEYRDLVSNEMLLEKIRNLTDHGRTLTLDVDKDDVFAHNLPALRTAREQWLLFLLWTLALWPLDVAARRVLIDWARVRNAAWALAIRKIPFLAARYGPKAPPDPTMAALLAQKERLRSEMRPPSEDQRGLFLDLLKGAKDRAGGEAEFDLRPGAGRTRRAVAPPGAPAPSSPGEAKKPASSIYASRLLDAKRRAMKDRGRRGG